MRRSASTTRMFRNSTTAADPAMSFESETHEMVMHQGFGYRARARALPSRVFWGKGRYIAAKEHRRVASRARRTDLGLRGDKAHPPRSADKRAPQQQKRDGPSTTAKYAEIYHGDEHLGAVGQRSKFRTRAPRGSGATSRGKRRHVMRDVTDAILEVGKRVVGRRDAVRDPNAEEVAQGTARRIIPARELSMAKRRLCQDRPASSPRPTRLSLRPRNLRMPPIRQEQGRQGEGNSMLDGGSTKSSLTTGDVTRHTLADFVSRMLHRLWPNPSHTRLP
uniref:Uncharacterized protein n=1 Tax=Mycena chlorophos TaxID=658473 RepID=A0ABQ0LAC6_MYCCL|nr:predicted protein [Mycena chlorophos]